MLVGNKKDLHMERYDTHTASLPRGQLFSFSIIRFNRDLLFCLVVMFDSVETCSADRVERKYIGSAEGAGLE